jgi:siroheme decarboxylase
MSSKFANTNVLRRYCTEALHARDENEETGSFFQKKELSHNLILFFRQARSYSMEKMTIGEKKVARALQHDIPLGRSPFEKIGASCNITAAEIVKMSQSFLQKGIMRKFGAILRHQKAGYVKNALAVWSVPPDQIEKAGKIFASFSFISHCYERKPAFRNKYNLFTMLHTQNDDIASIINEMAESINSRDFLILESLQEYKKISPEYF